MSAIHKEPFITPEMITAWNSGGFNPQIIVDMDIDKSVGTWSHQSNYKRYAQSKTITAQQNADILSSKVILTSLQSYAAHGALMGRACNIVDVDSIKASTPSITGFYDVLLANMWAFEAVQTNIMLVQLVVGTSGAIDMIASEDLYNNASGLLPSFKFRYTVSKIA